MVKLHLGCGINKKENYLNIDISKEVNPDMIVNLEQNLPFKNNSVDEILAEHVLEHIVNFVSLMHELHRICKDGAKIYIKVPFYTSSYAFTDPTHVRFFTPFTFDYFCNVNIHSHEVNNRAKPLFKKKQVYINYGFGKLKIVNFIMNPIINLNHMIYCRFYANILPASEIEFILEVTK